MQDKTKKIIVPIAVLALFIAISGVLILSKKAPEKKIEDKKIPYVASELIHISPLQLHVKSQGIVAPRYATELVAQVSGEVVSVAPAFIRGGRVKQGDVLAQIDPFNYQVKLEQAKASLANAKAAFILERAQGQVAEAEWAKISTAEPSELGLRKPQQEQALASVKAAQATLKQAQKDLDRTLIKAPYDAIIDARLVSPGTFVGVGAPLGSVSNTATAEVRLPIDQADFAYLTDFGLHAPVSLQTEFAGKTVSREARISRSEGIIDTNNRMIYIVAEIIDPYALLDDQLTALPFGTFVSAHVAGVTLAHAVKVPRSAISEQRIPTIVDDRLHFADIHVARHEGKYSIISAGLNNDDRIIISALDHPVEGMQINWQKQTQPVEASLPRQGANE